MCHTSSTGKHGSAQVGVKPPLAPLSPSTHPLVPSVVGVILVSIIFALRPHKPCYCHGERLSVLLKISCFMQYTRSLLYNTYIPNFRLSVLP